MKKSLIRLLPVLTLLFVACGGPSETTFDSYGISFTCPAGWSVTDDEDYGASQFVAVERNGLNSSGIVAITLFSDALEVDYIVELMQGVIEEQAEFMGLRFSELTRTTYGSHDALSYTYTGKIMTLPHEGRVYIFPGAGTHVFLCEQEATEDAAANAAGFARLRESFAVANE